MSKKASTPTPKKPAKRQSIKIAESTGTMPLRLEWRTPAELDDNPENWRLHPETQSKPLVAAIKEVGWAGAALYNERTKPLIDGHLRKKMPTETLVNGRLPVLVGSWSEDQERTILATLDPLASLAGVNKDALGNLLKQVHTDSSDVQTLLESLANEHGIDLFQARSEDGLTDPDDVPAPPDEPITKLGDRICLGNHVLLCGNSGSKEDLDKLLGGKRIQLVNTDPPYNVNVEPRSNNAIAAGLSSFQATNTNPRTHQQAADRRRHPEKGIATHKKLRAKDRPIANDFVNAKAFEQMLLDWFGNMARALEPGRAFYIWGGYANCANYPPALVATKLYFSQAIIWVKEHPVLGRKDFMGNHEWCFYGWKEGASHYFAPEIFNARDTWEVQRKQNEKVIDAAGGLALLPKGDKAGMYISGQIPENTRSVEIDAGPIFVSTSPSDVWRVKKVNGQAMVHLTEKPVELAARAMRYSSRPAENVLDLFGGSGSTLMGAEITGRHAYLMELDPLYCDVIVSRWEAFTGKKAKRPKTEV